MIFDPESARVAATQGDEIRLEQHKPSERGLVQVKASPRQGARQTEARVFVFRALKTTALLG